jgi:nucleoside-diphosphate-sugar epimerase
MEDIGKYYNKQYGTDFRSLRLPPVIYLNSNDQEELASYIPSIILNK